MNQDPTGELQPEFVRDFYNSLLSHDPQEYAYYRWFQTTAHQYQYRQMRRTLQKFLVPKRYNRAFEVGGGDGIWTEFLLTKTTEVDFLDISAEMIKRAQKRLLGKPVTYYEQDFLQNTLSSGLYDCAFSIRNFEYFPDKLAAIKQFNRLLKKGGDLIMVTKSPAYDWRGIFKNNTLHSGLIDIEQLIDLLKQHGFKVQFALPSIVGKKLGWRLSRVFFDLVHRLIIKTPFRILLPVQIGKYLAESYAILATKVASV